MLHALFKIDYFLPIGHSSEFALGLYRKQKYIPPEGVFCMLIVIIQFIQLVLYLLIVVEAKPCPGLAVFNYQYSAWYHAYAIHGHNQIVYVSVCMCM